MRNGYYTSTELAEKLRVPARSVRQWIQDGFIKPARTTPGGHARFNLNDVEIIKALLENHND